jgi:molybdopterin biosynthesis enzyme
MRDHSQHIELSREQAVASMLTQLKEAGFGREAHAPGRLTRVDVDEAYGRVLARDIVAKTDLPNALTCAMDSVALHWSDFAPDGEGAEGEAVACAAPQIPDTTNWVRGVDWQFANTGVSMPEGFDTAVVIEHVEVSEDEQHIKLNAAPSKKYAGTRAVGSNMHKGDLAVPAGTLITPDVAARIATAGYTSVEVLARPRVAFIPTGNELVPANIPFSPTAPEKYAAYGRVFESNSAVVRGKVEAWGGVFVPFDIVPDDYASIKAALAAAAEVADIIVLNAGSSKGSDDWSVEVLEEIGHIICHQTNHGPGHHSSYAIIGSAPRASRSGIPTAQDFTAPASREVPVVGISGPAGGASFTLNFYLRPLMFEFLGQDPAPKKIPARLKSAFPNPMAKPVANKQGVEGAADSAEASAPAIKGESRPMEKPRGGFFGVKFVMLEPDDQGVLWATPLPGRPGSAESQHANAYTLVENGSDVKPPAPGDIIQVELR